MSNVIDFRSKKDLIDVGGAIALCGCIEGGTPMNIIVSMDDQEPRIVGAICLTCKTRYDISGEFIKRFEH